MTKYIKVCLFILAALLLGEIPSPLKLAGAALILTGIFIASQNTNAP